MAAEPPGTAAPTTPKPPKYEPIRHREDWSPFLCVPTCDRCDLFDRWKAVRLGSDCLWANFGGQVRFRFESFDNPNFGTDADDSWLLSRVRLHADLHFGSRVRAYVEGIYADQERRELGPRATDENHGDFLNAFVEVTGCVGGGDSGLWAGRREMGFARQRTIGPLDWANTRRSFDGVGAWTKRPTWRLDAFAVRPVLVERDEGDEWDEDTDFVGVWYTNTCVPKRTVDAYALYLHKEAATFLKETREEDLFTVGAAATGPIEGTRFDFDVEAAVQFGSWGSDSILAGMATAEVGWKPCVPCYEPRVALGLDFASGDDGPGNDLHTYQQLFATGHLWFGWADLVGRQNVLAGRVTVTAKPTDKVLVRADLHRFFRANEDDALYAASGALLRAPGTSSETDVGWEADLQVKVNVDRHTEVEIGWAHVFAGDFLSETGPDDDVDFFYGYLTFTF